MTDTQPLGRLDGTVQRRSEQSTTLVGTAAWPLDELDRLRRNGGLDAVAARLGVEEHPRQIVR